MKRRPVPHYTRKRVNPHPSYVWMDGEDMDYNYIEFRRFYEPRKSPSWAAHKRARKLRTPHGQAMRLLRQQREEAVLQDMEALLDLMHSHQPRPAMQLLMSERMYNKLMGPTI